MRYYFFSIDAVLWPGEPFERKVTGQACSMRWDHYMPPSDSTIRKFLQRNARAAGLVRRITRIVRH